MTSGTWLRRLGRDRRADGDALTRAGGAAAPRAHQVAEHAARAGARRDGGRLGVRGRQRGLTSYRKDGAGGTLKLPMRARSRRTFCGSLLVGLAAVALGLAGPA